MTFRSENLRDLNHQEETQSRSDRMGGGGGGIEMRYRTEMTSFHRSGGPSANRQEKEKKKKKKKKKHQKQNHHEIVKYSTANVRSLPHKPKTRGNPHRNEKEIGEKSGYQEAAWNGKTKGGKTADTRKGMGSCGRGAREPFLIPPTHRKMQPPKRKRKEERRDPRAL